MNKAAVDLFKIDEGKLGMVNINNMLPTPIACLSEVLPQISDERYKNLLIKQTTYLNDHKKELLNKVKRFQHLYHSGFLTDSVMDRCCDFALLEEKYMEYKK